MSGKVTLDFGGNFDQRPDGITEGKTIELNGFTLHYNQPASPRTRKFFEQCGGTLTYTNAEVILQGGVIPADGLRTFQRAREQANQGVQEQQAAEPQPTERRQSVDEEPPISAEVLAWLGSLTNKPWKRHQGNTAWTRITAQEKENIQETLSSVGVAYRCQKVKDHTDSCVLIEKEPLLLVYSQEGGRPRSRKMSL